MLCFLRCDSIRAHHTAFHPSYFVLLCFCLASKAERAYGKGSIYIIKSPVDLIHPLPYISFQVTVPIPGSQLSLPNFGSAGQPLIALPQSIQPPLQHTPPQPQAQSLSRPAQVGQPFRGLIPAGTQHSIITGKVSVCNFTI